MLIPKGKYIGKCILCDKIGRLTKHHIFPLSIKPTSKSCLMICAECHRELNQSSADEQLKDIKDYFKELTN